MASQDKWVVLELSHQGEKKTQKELHTLLQQEIGKDVEIFIPSVTFTRRDSRVTICLMEGYFFIEAGLPSASYFELEEQHFVKRVLSQDEPSGRYICYVGQDVVDELKTKLDRQSARDIQIGDRVAIAEGTYSALQGEILDVFPEKERATVHIVDLESMEIIVELPFQFFDRVLEEAPEEE